MGAKGTQFEEMGRRRKAAARVSIVSNTGLVLGKLVVGVLMGSVAVISEAIHSSIDLLAALIAAYAVGKSAIPADEDHTYGHGKYEDLSGSIEAALIVVAAVVIVYEAAKRLVEGGDVGMPLLGMLVMAVSVVVNVAVSRYLFRVARETSSVALEADALHLSTDVWTSLGVMVAMAAIWVTSWYVLDAIVAIGVAVLIIVAAYNLTRRTIRDLVDAPLPEEDRAVILKVLDEHKDMHIGFDSIRTRRAGPERHIDLHLHFPSSMPLGKAHEMSHHIQLEIEERLGHAQVLIHLEGCERECHECNIEACPDRGTAAASTPSSSTGVGDKGEFH